jgi:cytochrome b6-f complex iron-sulfur subunit
VATEQSAAPRATGRIERARQVEARKLARRSFLRVSAFSGLMLFLGSQIAGFLAFFNLLKPTGFGGTVAIAAQRVPIPGGEPVRISEGKCWLVNLAGPELYWKCPHLGCSVPWNGAFNGATVNFPGIIGWFRCPCHGSTYSRAGIRVFGPAPRPMDTMAITVNGDGSLSVNTGQITSGDVDNPLRAVSYNG